MRPNRNGKNGLPILIRCDNIEQVRQLIKIVQRDKWWVNRVSNWTYHFSAFGYNCFGFVDGNETHKRDSDFLRKHFDVISFKQFMIPTIIELDENGDEIEIDCSVRKNLIF